MDELLPWGAGRILIESFLNWLWAQWLSPRVPERPTLWAFLATAFDESRDKHCLVADQAWYCSLFVFYQYLAKAFKAFFGPIGQSLT